MKMKHVLFIVLTIPGFLCAETFKQVPPTFGKTHFIIGMDPQQVSVPVQKPVVSLESPYTLLCKGEFPQVFFSPHDDIRKALIHLIEQEKRGISIASYAFTETKIVEALRAAYKKGIAIKILVDRSCLDLKGNKIQVLKKIGIPVSIFDGELRENGAIMHNKFIVFHDNGSHGGVVWTGSANITHAACSKNHENGIVVCDQKIYEKYTREFELLEQQSLRAKS